MSSRILLVSNLFPPRTVGGAEIVAFRQALAFAARGHAVTVLAGDIPAESTRPGTLSFDVHEGLPIYRLAMRSLDPDQNFHWAAAARRMKAIIVADRIEIVHFHNVMGLGANLIPAAKDAGTTCIVTLHDHWGFCFRQTRLRPNGSLCNNFDECAGCQPSIQPPGGTALPMRLRRDYVAWCLSQADRLITPSAYLASVYAKAGFDPAKISVVSNGIDLAAIPCPAKDHSSPSAVSFLCSAYLGEHKGILVLLEAMKQLAVDPDIASRWHVTIAGEGHLRPAIEKALQSAGLSGNVSLLGRVPRPDLLSLMSKADVAVLASVWPENEPVSMLEAIASASAQIATRTGGNLELVEHMKSGFLIEPGDAGGLAAAMRRYIDDPDLAAQHGTYNRERRQRFDENNTIRRLEEIMAETQSPAATVPERVPVIVCGAGWPALEVGALTSHAHEYLSHHPIPRFLWREWADARVWKDAVLLWLWDRHPEEWLVNAALRHGVPILAPANQWAEGLSQHYGGVVLYSTYLEALAAMRTILSVPTLHAELARRSRTASASATVMAPSTAFRLSSEAAPH